MRRPSIASVGVLVAALLMNAVARAQPVGDAAPAAELEAGVNDVNDAVKRGIELRRASKDEEALEVFRDALARGPASNRIRVHLAMTHQALGQWLEAQRYLREAMQHTGDPYIVRHRVELERSLDYVSARLGSLEVRGNPAGADVFLSGRHLGTLPLDALVLPTGSYELEVRKDGYYPAIRPLTIAGRGLLRERVDLSPGGVAQAPSNVQSRSAPTQDSHARPGFPWLMMTLAGVGAAGAVTASVAWIMRESYASRWNSADCLVGERTRGDNCASDLQRGRVAERVAIVSGVGAGLLLGSAATLLWLSADSDSSGEEAASGCFLGVGSVSCVGSF
jgi:PEGA domain